MPARKLPRTDDSRSAALGTCDTKYQTTASSARLISPAQFIALGGVLSPWRGARGALGPFISDQTGLTATCERCLHACVRENSHFIQILNQAIKRGALPASARVFYGLPVSQAEVPPMRTIPDALQWAAKLIHGEAARVSEGGILLSSPGMGVVSAAATELLHSEGFQSTAKDACATAREAVGSQRPEVDRTIKDLWDTIEYHLRADEPASLRRKAREWGVVYEGDEEPVRPTPPAP